MYFIKFVMAELLDAALGGCCALAFLIQEPRDFCEIQREKRQPYIMTNMAT